MARPQHGIKRLPTAESPLTRLATLLVVGALGATGLASTAQHPAGAARLSAAQQTAAPSVAPFVDARTRAAGRSTLRTPVHAAMPAKANPRRASAPKPARHVARASHAAPVRYIPTGTGIWIYEWRRTNHGDPQSIVRRARHANLSTLYVRTGSSWDGFNGGTHLRRLLAASRGTDVRVVAWDFPRLRHPGRDAYRLARAARVRVAGGRHVAAVAPDIETPSEGTFNAGWRVRTYLRALRHFLPADVSILTAVPWPSRYRVGDYPYGIVAAHSDVLVPMAYWYNNRPADVTARSIRYLRRFHRPVQPVGQGYDGRLDAPGLRHNNLSRQVPIFFRTAHQQGARAVSLWSWQAASPVVWNALGRSHQWFNPHH